MVALLAMACAAFALSPAIAHGDRPHGEAEAALVAGQQEQEIPTSDHAAVLAASPEPAETSDWSVVFENLHPAAVHFPIALLVAAAFTEALFAAKPDWHLQQSVRVMLWLAAGGAAVAAILGWVHTGLWTGGDDVMQRHRWVGTALPFFMLALAWIASHPPSSSRRMLRAGLAITAVLVVLQAFWGGELGHGSGHLFAGIQAT
ncbi:DUF2231 domain-containing protein [Qipengyuania nanhaisediminis]|uniref:DUF2231 domain-containing protein n=1 Tax=Qipengyuania nanhaisediminis TaxID=604088 RepID=UPI0038B4063D